MSDTTKPRWPLDDTARRGQDALVLCMEYRAALEPRLGAGHIAGLEGDLPLLTGSPADRQATRTAQKGKTGEERDLAADGHDGVMTARTLARRTAGIPDGTLKALGVGEKLSKNNTDAVKGAVLAILNAADAAPGLAPRLGLLPADLDDGRAIADALGGADQAQADAMTTGKTKTFDENVVQLRVEAAVEGSM